MNAGLVAMTEGNGIKAPEKLEVCAQSIELLLLLLFFMKPTIRLKFLSRLCVFKINGLNFFAVISRVILKLWQFVGSSD